MTPKETEAEDFVKKSKAYARIVVAVDATAKVLKGEDVIEAEKFEEAVKGTIRLFREKGDSSKKPEDLWDIFNRLLQEIPKEELFQGGEKSATVAVEVNGKILHVHIDRLDDTTFVVEVGQYYYSAEGNLEIRAITPESIKVTRERDLFIAEDPDTGLRVKQDQYLNATHQVEAVLATVGQELHNGEIRPKRDFHAEPAQLITAGTGTGKGGILCSKSVIYGSGIFAVPAKLVSDMVDMASNFTWITPVELPGGLSEPEVEKFLAENPYVVVSHEQLIRFAGILKGKNIFIDEVHEVATEANVETLRSLATAGNTRILALTATPTQTVYDIFGEPTFDLSLNKAQVQLKAVRQVSIAADKEVAKGEIAQSTVSSLLTRSGNVEPSMRGYSGNHQKDVRLSSQVQGMVFSDDPATARKTHELLSGLKSNADLQGQLNRQAISDRSSNGIAAESVDVYQEITAAQQQIIESKIMIEILTIIDPTQNIQDLEALARRGEFDAIRERYQNAVDTSDKETVTKKLEERGKAKPVLQRYYTAATAYLASTDTEDKKGVIAKLQQESGAVSVLLTEESSDKDIEDAKDLINKGLVMYIISSGPLGTGYSNSNVLSTVVSQEHPIVPGAAATTMQQFGRPIRGKDGFAFVSGIYDADLTAKQRSLSPIQVFSETAMRDYKAQIEIETQLVTAAKTKTPSAFRKPPEVIAGEKEGSEQVGTRSFI